MSEAIRMPAVAGMFYPDDPRTLDALVVELLAGAKPPVTKARPKALVVPHAGYVYSGAVAASAFALLAPHASTIARVVLIGPAHRVFVDGIVSPGARVLRTPLGDMNVDVGALEGAGVLAHANAHRREHSIEVELPFLQKVAPGATIVPLVCGSGKGAEAAKLLERLWGGDETVIVVSSDLSHHKPYDVARTNDAKTAARIVALDEAALEGDDACGCTGINALLSIARTKKLRAELVDLRSSGDTAGSKNEVVGYGSFAFYEGGAT